jgi:hypothetical protein
MPQASANAPPQCRALDIRSSKRLGNYRENMILPEKSSRIRQGTPRNAHFVDQASADPNRLHHRLDKMPPAGYPLPGGPGPAARHKRSAPWL